MTISEFFIGSASAVGSSTMGLINPGAGIIVSCSTALLTSIAILITNEYISKLKIRYTKLRELINVITLLYEKKTLKESMIDKKIDEKESEQLKQFDNHYIDKKSEIMKKTQFKVEDVFIDVISKDTISTEQLTKSKFFQPK